MKNTMKYAFVGALIAAVPVVGAAEKSATKVKACDSVQVQSAAAIAKSPEKVLQLVAQLVAANESCAGDVVKAAIKTTKANKVLVAQIVETAATAAPKQLSKITAAALAAAPDAHQQIAAVSKALSAKFGTAQAGKAMNPLDGPAGVNGDATVGVNSSGAGITGGAGDAGQAPVGTNISASSKPNGTN